MLHRRAFGCSRFIVASSSSLSTFCANKNHIANSSSFNIINNNNNVNNIYNLCEDVPTSINNNNTSSSFLTPSVYSAPLATSQLITNVRRFSSTSCCLLQQQDTAYRRDYFVPNEKLCKKFKSLVEKYWVPVQGTQKKSMKTLEGSRRRAKILLSGKPHERSEHLKDCMDESILTSLVNRKFHNDDDCPIAVLIDGWFMSSTETPRVEDNFTALLGDVFGINPANRDKKLFSKFFDDLNSKHQSRVLTLYHEWTALQRFLKDPPLYLCSKFAQDCAAQKQALLNEQLGPLFARSQEESAEKSYCCQVSTVVIGGYRFLISCDSEKQQST